MKRVFATIVIGCLVLTLNLSNATAAVKPGTTCKKLGQISTSAGIKYTCIKSGKKYVWNKGVKVVTKTVKPTPTPAATSNKDPVAWRFDGYREHRFDIRSYSRSYQIWSMSKYLLCSAYSRPLGYWVVFY